MDFLLLATVIFGHLIFSVDVIPTASFCSFLFLRIAQGRFLVPLLSVVLLFAGESGTSRGRSWSPSVAQLFPIVGKSYKIERKSGGFQFSILSNL